MVYFKKNASNEKYMRCFDTHIHSEGRSVEDLTLMAKEGIKAAVTCAFYPIKPLYQETLIDLFRKLVEFEKYRGKKAGMDLYAAIGIHPRCIPSKYSKVLEFMEEDDKSIAFGEIGLENATSEEIEMLTEQLKLAKKLDRPCVVHTPKNNKKAVTEKTIDVLDEIGFPDSLAVIDHVSPEIVEIVLKKGYYAGLTVEPGKLSSEEVISIIDKFGIEKFVLNSDTGFSPSEKIAVARTAKLLLDKFGESDAEKVAWKNAVEFLRL
jgi:hypothetical protein